MLFCHHSFIFAIQTFIEIYLLFLISTLKTYFYNSWSTGCHIYAVQILWMLKVWPNSGMFQFPIGREIWPPRTLSLWTGTPRPRCRPGTRAWNEGYPKVPEDFTITKKASTRTLKVPTSSLILRHYAKWTLTLVGAFFVSVKLRTIFYSLRFKL